MDSIRFDAATRALSTSGSRRGALQAFAAAGATLGLTQIGADQATAAKRKHKKKKRLGARCKKSDECKGELLCQNANSQNSCYDQTERRCCKKTGAECDDGCDCCGVDVICNGGFCQDACADALKTSPAWREDASNAPRRAWPSPSRAEAINSLCVFVCRFVLDAEEAVLDGGAAIAVRAADWKVEGAGATTR